MSELMDNSLQLASASDRNSDADSSPHTTTTPPPFSDANVVTTAISAINCPLNATNASMERPSSPDDEKKVKNLFGAISTNLPPGSAVVREPIVFYSYCWANEDIVKAFKARLDALGLAGWIDKEQLSPGDQFVADINSAIDKTKLFFAFLTPEYFASHSCCREYTLAAEWGKRIIPIVVEGKTSPWPPCCSISHLVADRLYLNVQKYAPLFDSVAFEEVVREQFGHYVGSPIVAPPVVLPLTLSLPVSDNEENTVPSTSNSLVKPVASALTFPGEVPIPVDILTTQLSQLLTDVALVSGNTIFSEDDAAVAVSQSPALFENASALQETVNTVAVIYSRFMDKTVTLKSGLRRAVHFVKDLPRRSELFLFPGCCSPNGVKLKRNHKDNLDSILKAEFLVVTDSSGTYNASSVDVIEGVQIEVPVGMTMRPHVIIFADTGNSYILSDGYSVNMCRKLDKVGQMSLHSKRPRT